MFMRPLKRKAKSQFARITAGKVFFIEMDNRSMSSRANTTIVRFNSKLYLYRAFYYIIVQMHLTEQRENNETMAYSHRLAFSPSKALIVFDKLR